MTSSALMNTYGERAATLVSGQGAWLCDADGNKYLDYGMGLRAVTVGYSDEEINKAAIEQINNGNCLTRPSLIELKAAETIVENIKNINMKDQTGIEGKIWILGRNNCIEFLTEPTDENKKIIKLDLISKLEIETLERFQLSLE